MTKYMVEVEVDNEYTKLELAVELAEALASINSYIFVLQIEENNE